MILWVKNHKGRICGHESAKFFRTILLWSVKNFDSDLSFLLYSLFCVCLIWHPDLCLFTFHRDLFRFFSFPTALFLFICSLSFLFSQCPLTSHFFLLSLDLFYLFSSSLFPTFPLPVTLFPTFQKILHLPLI